MTKQVWSKTETLVALAIIERGMGIPRASLTESEKRSALQVTRTLLQDGHSADDIMGAARFGMDEVWPFSNGSPWSPKDLEENITKAKVAVSRKRKRGEIPKEAEYEDG